MAVAIDDAFYLRGPLLREVQRVHAVTAVTAVVMTGMVLVGLILRPQGGLLRSREKRARLMRVKRRPQAGTTVAPLASTGVR